ncbi:MAG: hypothetical protein JO354_05880 [Verrucomicrobia bacterium]|nr:hypothetical protein [Verrucomicrobiota bacterium]
MITELITDNDRTRCAVALAAAVSLLSGAVVMGGAVVSTSDHLTPTEHNLDAEYKKTIEEKLFVTGGDYGRVLVMVGGTEGEYSVSVHSDQNSPTGVTATFTKAEKNVADATWAANENRVDAASIGVVRIDVAIPKSAALVIAQAWKRMLSTARQIYPSGKAEDVVLDGTNIELSLQEANASLREALITPASRGSKVTALRQAIELLARYCSAKPPDRPSIAREIQDKCGAILGP